MGCYVMEPEIFGMIPKGRPYGMDDVIRRMLAKNLPIASFAARKGFTDIGNKESYKRANDDYLRRLGNI